MRKPITMAMAMIALLICCALLSGCGEEEASGTAGRIGERTAQLSTKNHESFQQSSMYEGFRSADGGCYSMRCQEFYIGNNVNSGEFLYFSEDGTGEFSVLCGKKNCSHDSVDCDGLISGTTFGLYNDKIYYLDYLDGISGREEIYCMNPDGSERRKLTTEYGFADLISGCDDVLYKYCFDNGYMYFFIYAEGIYAEGKGVKLCRIKTEDGARLEYYDVGDIGYINRITPKDGYVLADALSEDGRYGLYCCAPDVPARRILDSIEDLDIMGLDFSGDRVRFYRGGTDGVCGFYECDVSTGKKSL